MAIDWASANRAASMIGEIMVRGADQAVQINQGMLNRNQQLNIQDIQNKHAIAMQDRQLENVNRNFDLEFGLQKQTKELENTIKAEGFKSTILGAIQQAPSATNYKSALQVLTKAGIDVSDAPKNFGADAMSYVKQKSVESGQQIEYLKLDHQKSQLGLLQQQLMETQRHNQAGEELDLYKTAIDEQKAGAEIGFLNAKSRAAGFGTMSVAPDGTETYSGPAVQQGTPGTQAMPAGMTKQAYIDLQKTQNKQIAEMNEDARTAQVAMQSLNAAELAITNYRGHQGFGGEVANKANAAMGLFSADAEGKYTEGQFIKAQSNIAALKTRVTEKMLGSLSDSDRQFLVDSVFSLNNTKETNLAIISGMKALQSSLIARANFMQAWRNGKGTLDGADAAFNEYMAANPLSRINDKGKVYFKQIDANDAAKFALTYKPGSKVEIPKDKASVEQVSNALGKTSGKEVSKDEYEEAVAKHGKDKVDAILKRDGLVMKAGYSRPNADVEKQVPAGRTKADGYTLKRIPAQVVQNNNTVYI